MRKWMAVLLTAGLLAGAAACGGDSEVDDLTAGQVRVAEAGVAAICADGQGGFYADELIELARDNPDGTVDGRSMRQVLADAASSVDRCDSEVARRLDRARETLGGSESHAGAETVGTDVEDLDPAVVDFLVRWRETIAGYCSVPGFDEERYIDFADAVEGMIGVARVNPEASIEAEGESLSMSALLTDAAAAASCDQEAQDRLYDAAASAGA